MIVEKMSIPEQQAKHIITAKDLGHAIRDRRKMLDMTQADLAMQAGVSTPTVSAIENGKETAQIGLVLQLCQDIGLRLTTVKE
jgi:y4mF family transcriptional regulator